MVVGTPTSPRLRWASRRGRPPFCHCEKRSDLPAGRQAKQSQI